MYPPKDYQFRCQVVQIIENIKNKILTLPSEDDYKQTKNNII